MSLPSRCCRWPAALEGTFRVNENSLNPPAAMTTGSEVEVSCGSAEVGGSPQFVQTVKSVTCMDKLPVFVKRMRKVQGAPGYGDVQTGSAFPRQAAAGGEAAVMQMTATKTVAAQALPIPMRFTRLGNSQYPIMNLRARAG